MVISDQPVADFSHLTAPEQLAAISRIEDVALVIVPESLAAAYTAIPVSDVAATIYVPDGANVRVHTGALVAGGDGLGAADDVLIVTGMLLITSPVTGQVPKQIHVTGSVYAPRGSEAALGPALAGSTGSVSYFPFADGQDTKVLTGQLTLSGAMLANPARTGRGRADRRRAGGDHQRGYDDGLPAVAHRRAAGGTGGQPRRDRASGAGNGPGRLVSRRRPAGLLREHQSRPGLFPPARSSGEPDRARET